MYDVSVTNTSRTSTLLLRALRRTQVRRRHHCRPPRRGRVRTARAARSQPAVQRHRDARRRTSRCRRRPTSASPSRRRLHRDRHRRRCAERRGRRRRRCARSTQPNRRLPQLRHADGGRNPTTVLRLRSSRRSRRSRRARRRSPRGTPHGSWNVNYTITVTNPSSATVSTCRLQLADTLPTLPSGWTLVGEWDGRRRCRYAGADGCLVRRRPPGRSGPARCRRARCTPIRCTGVLKPSAQRDAHRPACRRTGRAVCINGVVVTSGEVDRLG